MLGLAGLGALRHAALPTTDSMLIVLLGGRDARRARAVDRAQAERDPAARAGARHSGHASPKRCGSPRSSPRSWSRSRSRSCRRSPTTSAGACGPARCRRSATGTLRPGPSRTTPRLDMTSRPRLSDRVVFTVDAPRADFWRGEVFDTWDGQSSWTRSDDGRAARLQRDGNTYQLQPDPYDVGAMHGTAMRQTFHIETGFSEVLFAAPSAVSVESDRIILGHADGTAAVLGEFGKDAVYTVDEQEQPADRGRPARGRRSSTSPVRSPSSTRTPPRTSTTRPRPRRADHRGRAHHLRQDPRHRAMAVDAHPVLVAGAAVAARRRRRRLLPLHVAPRLVRAGVEQHGGARAQRRHPRPPRDRVRAGREGRSLGPLRRPRARRARLDRDLLPRGRLAGVRPDRVGAARG